MTLAAERIKLSTTRAPLWTGVVVAVLSLGFAALQAAATMPDSLLQPERAAIGVAAFSVPVLMILAATTITSEYRTQTICTTFLASPNRTAVLCAKAGLTAVLAGVFAAAMVVASILVAQLLVAPQVGVRLSLAHAATWRPVGAIGLYAALGAVLAVGLGALLRHAAVVVAILVLLPFVVEPLLGAMPRIGERVGPLLPFANALAFTKVPWVQFSAMWWGPVGALVYFTSVVAVVFTAAVFVINRRDA